jgi:hypothetical protein
MKYLYTKRFAIYVSLMLPAVASAQTGTDGSINRSTAVPFLNIAPDSRSGAMGEAGVALSPDVNANYWNPAKLAFMETGNDIALSYSPWLRHLVPDINLAYLSFAHKLDDRNTLGASLRYFNLGSIQLIDRDQNDQGTYKPSEFSLDASFARKFGNNFSLGLTMRYINSNFDNAAFVSGSSTVQNKAGNAISAGVSLYYKKDYGDSSTFAFGANISNIGSKIAYSDVGAKYFLPANLKLGVANTWRLDGASTITATLDFNKLLIPTPPLRDGDGNITSGKDDNVSVPAGIFQSFGDAPGGFSEELKEISLSPGLEYWYNNLIALRAGYFYGNPSKGTQRYATFGVGLKYQVFTFDFAYLAASQQSSPLANTLRFTLSASFGGTGSFK